MIYKSNEESVDKVVRIIRNHPEISEKLYEILRNYVDINRGDDFKDIRKKIQELPIKDQQDLLTEIKRIFFKNKIAKILGLTGIGVGEIFALIYMITKAKRDGKSAWDGIYENYFSKNGLTARLVLYGMLLPAALAGKTISNKIGNILDKGVSISISANGGSKGKSGSKSKSQKGKVKF